MSAPVDVLAWIQRQPCRCMSVAQLGERDPGCGRCLSRAAVAELIEAADALADEQVYSYLDEPDYEPETSEPATNRNRHQRAYWRLRAALARCGGAK